MPTYEYECEKEHHWERFQQMTEAPEKTCPKCGAIAKRLIGKGGAVIFKGTGFYETDSKVRKESVTTPGKKPK